MDKGAMQRQNICVMLLSHGLSFSDDFFLQSFVFLAFAVAYYANTFI